MHIFYFYVIMWLTVMEQKIENTMTYERRYDNFIMTQMTLWIGLVILACEWKAYLFAGSEDKRLDEDEDECRVGSPVQDESRITRPDPE